MSETNAFDWNLEPKHYHPQPDLSATTPTQELDAIADAHTSDRPIWPAGGLDVDYFLE